jgi:hypothetical protein
LPGAQVQAAEVGGGIGIVESASQGVLQRFGLLVDLLEHVVLEDPLVDVLRFPVDGLDRGFHDGPALVQDSPGSGRENAYLVVLEEHDLVGFPHQGPGIAAQEVLLFTDAQNQGTAQASPDDHAGTEGADQRQPIGPLEQGQGSADGIEEFVGSDGEPVAVAGRCPFRKVVGNEMGDDLGIGIALEEDAIEFQLPAQDSVVLDDAVVDESHPGSMAGSAQVRVGVAVGGRAMRGPAGMADTNAAGSMSILEVAGQVLDSSGLLAKMQGVTREGGQSRTVVAPVFDTPESLDKDGFRGSMPGIANDPAHGRFPP